MSVTVLDLVQDVLSDADSDDVNSIDETIEAGQAARLVKSIYETICDEFDLETTKGLRQLTGLGDTTRPTHLLIPEGVHSIEMLEYDIRDDNGDAPRWSRIQFLEPDDFLIKVNHFANDGANVQSVTDFGGGSFQIRNDLHPSFYTSFDSQYVVFESFRQATNSTLIGAYTRAIAIQKPTLVLANTTVVQLPRHLESLLKSELKVMFFDLFKDGVPNTLARAAMRQRVRADRTKNSIRGRRPSDKLPDYGRHCKY